MFVLFDIFCYNFYIYIRNNQFSIIKIYIIEFIYCIDNFILNMISKKGKPKIDDYIELKEIKEISGRPSIHLTEEESRKIIPKEVKNLKMILNNQSSKYSWDVHGDKVNN
jgi:hypothetical protein